MGKAMAARDKGNKVKPEVDYNRGPIVKYGLDMVTADNGKKI